MSWTEQLTSYTDRFWQKRREEFQELGEKADRILSRCTPEEEKYLRFVLATVPLSDLSDYKTELFLHIAQSALRAREEFPWCKALPEHLFLIDVLYPRINTEELSDCRGPFHDALADRIRGLSLTDAILEVNRWCAEEVTYRSTDDRTASALSVYCCGYGRCGEESTFAVNALRSVGICARQVYAPWWSHCDDNHAWVEVYDGAGWRYLGACEPEPELDRGWFTSAASRAMMIHARAFAPGELEEVAFLFPDAAPVDLWTEHGVVYEAVTHRYAETRELTVSVRDGAGKPAPNAEVTFSLLNMAQFLKISVQKTGQDGTAKLRLGLGSVKVSAAAQGSTAEAIFSTGEQDHVELTLQNKAESDWQDFEFFAPIGMAGYPAPLSPIAQKHRREILADAAELREQKQRRIQNESKSDPPEQKKQVLAVLTEKDRAGELPEEIFHDALPAFCREESFPPEIFSQGLLSPRIGLEPLRPWRKELSEWFSPAEREGFRAAPETLLAWIDKNVPAVDSYVDLPASPLAVWKTGAASSAGKNVLFCALCRSFEIPARLSPVDGTPEYYQNGSFRAALGEKAVGMLEISTPAGQGALFFQNVSLTRLDAEREVPLKLADIPAGDSMELALLPGMYRAVCTTRMPNGNQLARQKCFRLEAGQTRRLELTFREGKIADMLESQGLPPFLLRDGTGRNVESRELLEKSAFSLLFWLEVGREPTEHILNELREAAEAFAQSGCALHFLLESPEQERDATLRRTLSLLPDHQIWYGDFQDTVPQLARRMFVDPEKLPLVILADCKGNGLYACSGYNVGTGKLLLSLLAELGKQ